MTDAAQVRIAKYLDEHHLATAVTRVMPLTGDASDRQYYRALLAGGGSIVLALHTGPIEFDRMPFVANARLMSAISIPVPRILHHSDALGIIGLEDLGDVTLQAHLGVATPDEHAALYREAVELIIRMQQRGAEVESPEYPAFGVAFDVEKLTWELEFFVKHFVMAYRGATPAAAARQALSEEWAAIAGELAGEPRVLCHRDYHSRNLMLRDGALCVIDFQDARMGPNTYDLVSLLRDSYVDLSPGHVDALMRFFLEQEGGPPTRDRLAEFARRFDLMALQRNLKALGTFGYQTATRANPVYIQYIPRTIRHVRANLARHGRFARLRTLLVDLVADFA